MSGININSEAWCRKAYLNYHCYDNSMGISARDMAAITQRWQDRLSSWQKSVSSDENEYDFDDSDYSAYKDNGRKAARDATGYSGNDTGNIINGSLSAGAGIGGAAWNLTTGGFGAVIDNSGLIFSPTSTKLAPTKTVFKETGTLDLTGKNNTHKIELTKETDTTADTSTYVQAAMAIATAAMYYIKKPNKDEVEAANEMINVLGNAQGSLEETQGEMADMSEELIELSDEANAMNEEANEQMKDDKTEFDLYRASLEALQAKIESGQPLTKEEQAFYNELVKIMGELGISISETSEETTEVVGEIYGDMETYQDGYDYAAETMGEVEGMTDYAEGFDSATRTMCYVEGAGQIANAASGAMAGAKLMGMGFWNWALGIASIAAGVSSGVAATQQFEWAGEVGKEIDTREMTQDLNAATNDIYTEEIDAYDGFMTGIEDLEMEVPEDLEMPETAPVGGGGETKPADEPEKKPEEEE